MGTIPGGYPLMSDNRYYVKLTRFSFAPSNVGSDRRALSAEFRDTRIRGFLLWKRPLSLGLSGASAVWTRRLLFL